MTRISAAVDIAATPALIIHALQETMTDPRLLAAYKSLRAGKEYSGFVTMLVPERRMVIQFAGLDPSTNRRSHSAGWTVTYDFTPGPDGMTHVEISIEYRLMTALMSAGTAKVQAENEIEMRLMGLRMLEAGVQGLQAGEPPRLANPSNPAND